MLTRLRRTSAAADTDNDPAPTDATAPSGAERAAMTWTGGAQLATRGVSVLLWAALASGPLALFAARGGGPAPVRAAAPVQTLVPGDVAAAGEFAESFVVAWLSTGRSGEEQLRAYYRGPAALTRPQVPWTVANAATADVVSQRHGLWTVIVGVDVVEPAPAATPSGQPASTARPTAPPPQPPAVVRRYFQLVVRHAQVGDVRALAAQTLPAPVPAPAGVEPLADEYGDELTKDSPVSAAAGDFLAAMLTGVGDVTRYSSPQAQLTAITPPPYTKVRLLAVAAVQGPSATARPGDGTAVRVLATVELAGMGSGQRLTAQYAITLTARGGRWEVSALDAAPAVEPPTPTPATSTGAPTPTEGEPR